MAEIRQFAHSGKEIDEAVEKVENGTVYEAGEGITIEGNTISASASAQSLEAGVGIDISDGAIEVEIPTIASNVALSDEEKAHIQRGLPIKQRNTNKIFYYMNADGTGIYYYQIEPYTYTDNPYELRVCLWRYTSSNNKFNASLIPAYFKRVTANPTLSGTEGSLNSIKIGDTSYTVGSPLYLHQIHFTKAAGTDLCTITIMGITKDATAYSNIGLFNVALNIQATKEYYWLSGYFRNGSVSPALVSTDLSYKKFATNAAEITANFVDAETGSATVRTMSIAASDTVTDIVVPI